MINHKLYYEIWKMRKEDPKYCFPLNMFLGVTGLIVNHPLVGKTFVQIESGVAVSYTHLTLPTIYSV